MDSPPNGSTNRCSTKVAVLFVVLFIQFLLLLFYSPLLEYGNSDGGILHIFADKRKNASVSKGTGPDPFLRQIWKGGVLRPIFPKVWDQQLRINRSDLDDSSSRSLESPVVTSPKRTLKVTRISRLPSLSTTQPDPPGPNPKCGYLARMPPAGRLGSQMFAYATFYGIARRQKEKSANKTVFIRVWEHPHYLKPIFEPLSVEHWVVSKKWFDQKDFALISEPAGCCRHDISVAEGLKCDGRNIYVDGYRMSYKYFAPYMEEIRKEFSFQNPIKAKSYQLLNDSLSKIGLSWNNCTVVGAHLRRGDFAELGKAVYGHMPAQLDYLQRAVRFYETKVFASRSNTSDKKFSSLVFVLFGNDYDWNLNVSRLLEVQEPKRTHFVAINFNKSEAAVDMHAMSLCDNVIITTGTFSWWCAFFSRGTVTYQKEYAMPNSFHHAEYEPADYFLPRWIPL